MERMGKFLTFERVVWIVYGHEVFGEKFYVILSAPGVCPGGGSDA